MTAPTGHRFLLIAPWYAASRRTGGGQRTALFFDALLGLGPTDVMLSGRKGIKRFASAFEGAAAVHPLPENLIRQVPKTRVLRAVWRLANFLAPLRVHAPRAAACKAVEDLIVQRGITCVVYHYTGPLTLTDAAGGSRDGLTVLVDLDDREDHKYLTFVADRLGASVAGSGFFRRRAEGLHALIVQTLAKTSLVWLVKASDRLDVDGPRITEIPNVPLLDLDHADLALPSESNDILFVGTAEYPPNRFGIHWFLSKVWPQIAAQSPTARVRIVGMGDWTPLSSQFGKDPRIVFVGAVDSLRAEYAGARLCIVPVFSGAGSQIKLIEACGYGRPVVSSAFSNHGYGEEIAALVSASDTPDGFAEACLALLQDGEAANRTGAALCALQRQHYSREAMIARIRADIARVLQDAATTGRTSADPVRGHQAGPVPVAPQ